jgi:hypothetical protein
MGGAKLPSEKSRPVKGELKRGEVPLKTNLPLPLSEGKGIQGIGLNE